MSDARLTQVGGESIVFTTRKHWAASIADSGWAIAMIVAAFLLSWVEPGATSGLLGFLARSMELIQLGLFFGGAVWIIYNVIARRSAEYSVTNQRVLGRDGLIRRRETDILLSSITDVRTVSSVYGRACGYATVRITSQSGDAGEDAFTAMARADEFKQHVLEQKAAMNAQHVEAAAIVPAAPAATSTVLDYAEVIGQLARLRDAGALTEEEYDAKKVELLGRL